MVLPTATPAVSPPDKPSKAGMACVSSLPQREQMRCSSPSALCVGSWVTVHSPRSCPRAGIVFCSWSVSPQTDHFSPSVRPLSVQVAAFPTTSSGECPAASIFSVLRESSSSHTVQ